MSTETETLKKPVDEIVEVEGQSAEDTARYHELKKKTDKNADELVEFNKLADNYGKNVKGTINKLTGRLKESENKAAEKEKEVAELKAKYDELEKKVKVISKPITKKETVVLGEEQYYTDEALQSMVEAQEITQYEAYQHQRARDKAEIRLETEESIFKKLKKDDDETIRAKDAEEVLKKYPHFAKNHPEYNPDDPLLKQVNRVWAGGFHNNPRGFSEALRLAEELLGVHKNKADRTNDFSVSGSDISDPDTKPLKITVSNEEKNIAIRNYHFGGLINPTTGRVYTEQEAVAKYTKEKEDRVKNRKRI